MDPLYLVALVWIGCAILAAAVANVRHTDPTKGFLLGLILGPLGLLLAAVQKPAQPVRWDR